MVNNPTYRAIPNPSSHGFSSAIGLAKFFGILANKGQDMETKAHMLSEETINLLTESLIQGWDEVLKMDLTYGRGMLLRSSPNVGGGGEGWLGDGENNVTYSLL